MCNSILYTYYHLKIIVLCLEKTCMSFLLYWFLSEKECIYLHVYMYVYQLKQFLKWLYIDIRINSEIWFTKGNGTPLQYCCLENPMDGGAWWAAVHRVAKSQTRLSDFTFTFHFHALEKEMATHSSVLAWRISWTEKPGRLQSMGLHKVGHNWSDFAAAFMLQSRVFWTGLSGV